jgi:hypothetical protein
VKEIQELTVLIPKMAAEIETAKASKKQEGASAAPAGARLLTTIKQGLPDLEEELRARNDRLINEQLDWLARTMETVSENAGAADLQQVANVYDELMKAYNPEYKGGVASSMTTKAKAPRKKKPVEDDLEQEPYIAGINMASAARSWSDKVCACSGCEGSKVPLVNTLCKSCAADAVRALMDHVLACGLHVLRENNDPALDDMKERVSSLRDTENEFRKLAGTHKASAVTEARKLLETILKEFNALKAEFSSKHDIDLVTVAAELDPDEVCDEYDPDEEDEDDEEEDEEEEEEGEDEEDEISSPSGGGKKNKRRARAEEDDDEDLEDLVVSSGEAEREEEEAAKKRHRHAHVVAPKGGRAAAAEHLLSLEMDLPGEVDKIKELKRRWKDAKEDVEFAALNAELKRLEDSWSTYYVLEIQISTTGKKRKAALVESMGPWNCENKASLGALEYKQKHAGVEVKVVEKKRGDQ